MVFAAQVTDVDIESVFESFANDDFVASETVQDEIAVVVVDPINVDEITAFPLRPALCSVLPPLNARDDDALVNSGTNNGSRTQIKVTCLVHSQILWTAKACGFQY